MPIKHYIKFGGNEYFSNPHQRKFYTALHHMDASLQKKKKKVSRHYLFFIWSPFDGYDPVKHKGLNSDFYEPYLMAIIRLLLKGKVDAILATTYTCKQARLE